MNDNKNTTFQNLWEQLKKGLEEIYYFKKLILNQRNFVKSIT